MEAKFIKLENESYNIDYVKYIKCNDNHCWMALVNTKSGSSYKYAPYTDSIHKYSKDTSPANYYKLREVYNNKK